MKDFQYRLEAAGLWLAFRVFRMLSAEQASNLGGWIGRNIGPHLAASRKALANLKPSFPEKTGAELTAIMTDMWDNLGRVMAEYPHLETITMNHVEVVGEKNLIDIGINSRCIVIGAHLANWELVPFYCNYRINWPISGIYRAPNNPYAEKLLEQCRNPEQRGAYIPKSQKGTRAIIKTLQDGGRLGVLIDQKYNQGIAAPFFGRPAMTSSAFSQLAAKFDCPIVPMQIERLQSCNFRITLHSAFKTDGHSDEEIVARAHRLLEDWIRQRPGQWLWLHRRWDSKALKNLQD